MMSWVMKSLGVTTSYTVTVDKYYTKHLASANRNQTHQILPSKGDILSTQRNFSSYSHLVRKYCCGCCLIEKAYNIKSPAAMLFLFCQQITYYLVLTRATL